MPLPVFTQHCGDELILIPLSYCVAPQLPAHPRSAEEHCFWFRIVVSSAVLGRDVRVSLCKCIGICSQTGPVDCRVCTFPSPHVAKLATLVFSPTINV